jgi:hypothetical protein
MPERLNSLFFGFPQPCSGGPLWVPESGYALTLGVAGALSGGTAGRRPRAVVGSPTGPGLAPPS